MDYNKKLKIDRYRPSANPKACFDDEMESDRGRAVNSAAVRRLQQKTQVFPLESNAAVRSRLTHSLEVQQVGRYIAKLVLKQLKSDNQHQAIGLDDKFDGFTSAVEIACLLHDVGNPPFGHFGEEAINMWSRSALLPIFEESFGADIKHHKLLKDLMVFEGNAQAIRLLHGLQDLNLTNTQIACLIKYTRPAYQGRPTEGSRFYYRQKKPGFYYSEQGFIAQLNESLQIGEGCRFPLTYIMEAADDISYCIADLEDALDKGILSVDQLHAAILSTWQQACSQSAINLPEAAATYLCDLANHAYQRYTTESHSKRHAYILTLRTKLVNDLAQYAANRYLENHQAVFDGTLDESLLDGNDKYNLATETLKKVAHQHVFSVPEVERLELKGHAIISGLLNIYTPLLQLNIDDFKQLSQANWLKTAPIETRLYHHLSSKHKRRYCDSVKHLWAIDILSPEQAITEMYYRSRLIIDYVSGMTDGYALDEFRSLSALG